MPHKTWPDPRFPFLELSIASPEFRNSTEFEQEEDALVGSDHCVVGGLLAKTWSPPEAVCKTIIHHHTSNLTGQGPVPTKLIALLKVADYIAYTFGYSIGLMDRIIDNEWDPEEWSELNEAVLGELHLGPDDLIDMKDNIFEQLSAQ